MRPVGGADDSRLNLQQTQQPKGTERAHLTEFLLIAEEETRSQFQQTQETSGTHYARLVGLLLMAASALVSLHLISIVADLSALVFQSAYLLIVNSVG